jgi:hypothetical protein
MGFVQGEGRTQGTLILVTLEELIPDDRVCRVIEVFLNWLDMATLEFECARRPTPGGLVLKRVRNIPVDAG